MPGYHDDDTVLQVCVEEIEATLGQRRLRGKDDHWWEKFSDAMWNMVDIHVAADVADLTSEPGRRATS